MAVSSVTRLVRRGTILGFVIGCTLALHVDELCLSAPSNLVRGCLASEVNRLGGIRHFREFYRLFGEPERLTVLGMPPDRTER
jgi:hypothetical protein